MSAGESLASPKLTGFIHFLKQVYTLVRPYGLRKLLLVTLVSLLQAVSQVISVAAIFPFLSLAADPTQFSTTKIGRWLVGFFPGMEQQELLFVTGIALVFALFVANAFNLFGEFYRARFTWGFIHWLRMRMFRRMNARPYSWFLRQNSSILIKKTTQDMLQFINNILGPIIDGSARLMVTILLIGTIVVAEPGIALLVGLVLGSIYSIVFIWLSQFRKHLSDALKIHWRGVFQNVGQFLSGIKPVMVHGVEAEFIGRIEEHSRQQSELQAWMPIVGNGPRYLIEPIIAAVFIFLVLQSMASGENTAALVPSLGLVAMAGYRLLPAVQMLYSHLSTLQTSRFVLDEIYDEFREAEEDEGEIFDEYVDKQTCSDLSFSESIKLKNVSFSYSGGHKYILRGINVNIPKGTSVAFVGETGSGKSTLVDLILGLHRPTEGYICIDGVQLDNPQKVHAWQDRVGYVPQDIFLADDNLRRNIAFGVPDDEIDDARILEVAAMAQISNFIESELPEKFETEVGERGVRLSGGQRQRIALARALYHSPEVLLLDEATSALDNMTEDRFMDTVYRLVGQYTVIMVAHRINTTHRADVHFLVKGGKVEVIDKIR